MYTLRCANGEEVRAGDFIAAMWVAVDLFGECHIGCCETENSDYRWFVWASEEDSRDDDAGARAVAEIRCSR